MAHVGTSGDLAKRPATTGVGGQAFWQAVIALIVATAIGFGLVLATSLIAGSNTAGVPAADHRYDQVESLRGGATIQAAEQPVIGTKQVMPGDSGATPNYTIGTRQVMPGDSGATPDYAAKIVRDRVGGP